jgi:hypothetical protein
MNYHSKYLKYKEKYFNLKNLIGGTDPKQILIDNLDDSELIDLPDDFFKQLEKIYNPSKNDTNDMNYEGMGDVLNYLDTNHKMTSFDKFIDLGSGHGKLALQFAALPNIKESIGIEPLKEHHDYAEEIKEKLQKFKSITEKVLFVHNDFDKSNLSKYITGETLVWISNLPIELTNKIFNNLLELLPSNSIIVCSKEHSLDTNMIKKIGSLNIPMTIYLYKVL